MQVAIISFIAAIMLSPMIAALARRNGVVSGLGGVRWSNEPKPLLGGISILLGMLIALTIIL
jgi:UDP-N-acetylmuramyl pentapeptide phosphotransferase/UDP-N-acetylglucosamine-1-phosphate transferase